MSKLQDVVRLVAFRAEFDGGNCWRCKEMIRKGDMIAYTDNRQPEHVDCDEVEAEIVVWANSDSVRRQEAADAEEERIAPLQRPMCSGCFTELPKSLICGVC